MRKVYWTAVTFCFWGSLAYAASGLIAVKSHHSVQTTADRLEAVLQEKGMTVFARINHAEGAQKVGETLRPTELLIFGNPKVGTPFIQCGQSVAIDLPQKALIWEDATGQVWLAYNDPQYLASRHGIAACGDIASKIKKALENFANAATMP